MTDSRPPAAPAPTHKKLETGELQALYNEHYGKARPKLTHDAAHEIALFAVYLRGRSSPFAHGAAPAPLEPLDRAWAIIEKLSANVDYIVVRQNGIERRIDETEMYELVCAIQDARLARGGAGSPESRAEYERGYADGSDDLVKTLKHFEAVQAERLRAPNIPAGVTAYLDWKQSGDSSPSNLVHAILHAVGAPLRSTE